MKKYKCGGRGEKVEGEERGEEEQVRRERRRSKGKRILTEG